MILAAETSNLLEIILVAAVVLAAVAVAAWKFWRTLTRKRNSCCGQCACGNLPKIVKKLDGDSADTDNKN